MSTTDDKVRPLIWKTNIFMTIDGEPVAPIVSVSEPTPNKPVNRFTDLDRDTVGYGLGTMQYTFTFDIYAYESYPQLIRTMHAEGTQFDVGIGFDLNGGTWKLEGQSINNCIITNIRPPTYNSGNMQNPPVYSVTCMAESVTMGGEEIK